MTGEVAADGADAGTASQRFHGRRTWRTFLIAATIVIISGVLQLYLPHWLLNAQVALAFNAIVEVSSAALFFFIFGVRWMTRGFRVDSRTLFISCAFLALAVLTVARLLTYSGMPLAGSYNELVNAPYFGTFSNFSDSLYYDAVIRHSVMTFLLIGAFLPSDNIVKQKSISLYPYWFMGFAGFWIAVISIFGNFLPQLYVKGEEMSPFMEEISVSAMVIGFLAALVFARLASKSTDRGYAVVSLGLLLTAEAQFSYYRVDTPLDVYLLIGRTMAVLALFIIFVGLVRPSLIRPYMRLESTKQKLDATAKNLEALANDIMERREAEERILALNADLQASNKELESFSYSVSHDLRAPLRTIEGYGKFLADEEGGRLSPRGKEYVMRMRAGCERMGLIIEDLLKLSRVAREEISITQFDITTLVRTVVDETRAATHRDLEFVSCGPEMVEGDERLLKIALENMIHNSWKFTSKTEHPTVEFGATQQNGVRVFFVKDNGAGFDMQYSSRLFRPFERLHSESEFPGTGVGLASVQRVVERHGGKIWAEGKVGEGATFYFTLERGASEKSDLSPRP